MKSIFTITLLLAFTGLVNGQSLIHIPQDAPSLSDAAQMAQDGDTIYLSPGIYTDTVHIYNRHLIFTGEPGGESILSPGANERTFVLLDADVEFMHLRFDDFDLQSPPPNFAISASYSNVSIAHCEFHSLFSPVSLLWGDLTIHSSKFSNTRNGKCIRHNGGTFLLYNNLFYDLTNTPISINRAHGEFFNNTVVGSTPNQYRGLIINSDSVSHLYNNIITGFGIGIQLIASDSVEFDALRIHHNNIYDMAVPYWYEYNEDLSLPIYSGELTANPGVGEISVSPTFTADDQNDYTLQDNSPCIDAGLDAFSFSVPSDLAGNERIIGSDPDIGAYEYSSTLSSRQLPKASQNPIKLFPNPTYNDVWIDFNEEYTGSVEVLDSSGKIRQSLQINKASKIEIDLPPESGLYLIKVSDYESSVTGRVVKL